MRRFVLDASVAVAAARVDRVVAGTDEIVVPALFRVEVASALTRAGVGAAIVIPYVQQLMSRATLVTMGPKRAASVQAVAMKTRLRVADAAYVWLAGRENVSLLTSDTEVLTRAAPICIAERP
jgi:predicted nucleic acid-binding protein